MGSDSEVVIKAENLGKKYIIGHQGPQERYTALRDVVGRTVKGFVRSARDMIYGRAIVSGDEQEEFWALKDIKFEIKRGEVVGIIGRNGAGKSTLLKVLSRITEPSEGRVTIKGRVASLLEVGTGFHPELTGRENIYLNGAILGMTRAEIKRKFDEIVDFAGVEKFLDTPVKRYSSGMYVRLAFAVAAHLEPEILVIDEVLAVGDAEFQKKCLGKMGEVAKGGRTVLFVSHNLGAVQALCPRCLLIQNGRVSFDGNSENTVASYLSSGCYAPGDDLSTYQERGGVGRVRVCYCGIVDKDGKQAPVLVTGNSGGIRITLCGDDTEPRPGRIGISVFNGIGELLFNCATDASYQGTLLLSSGSDITLFLPRIPLGGGEYYVSIFLEREGTVDDYVEKAVKLVVSDAPFFGTSRNVPPGWEGKSVLIDHSWRVNNCHR